jgi:beta-lactam-binding protein with PASTA domain
LTATAAATSSFAGWSGACAGTGSCTVTIDQDRAVTATFNQVLRAFTCIVPNVKRKPLATAKRLIDAAHCRVGRVKRAHSKLKQGLVVAQSPPPGRTHSAGFRIDLVVSSGKR